MQFSCVLTRNVLTRNVRVLDAQDVTRRPSKHEVCKNDVHNSPACVCL
jgi:hypothetical protein